MVLKSVKNLLAALTVAGALGLGACASVPEDAADRAARAEANDPIEGVNRLVFALNETLDVFIIRPVAVTYRDWMPEPIKNSIANFLNYLRTPLIIANDLMQGEYKRAEVAAARFMINSLALGIADIAGEGGMLPRHDEDFGQTLARWGSGEGFYLVLPLIGPSNVRDAAGMAVEWVLDPVNYVARQNDHDGLPLGRAIAGGIDSRARLTGALDDLKNNSFDYYAAMRTAYRQRRAAEIRNQNASRGSMMAARTAPVLVAPASSPGGAAPLVETVRLPIKLAGDSPQEQ